MLVQIQVSFICHEWIRKISFYYLLCGWSWPGGTWRKKENDHLWCVQGLVGDRYGGWSLQSPTLCQSHTVPNRQHRSGTLTPPSYTLQAVWAHTEAVKGLGRSRYGEPEHYCLWIAHQFTAHSILPSIFSGGSFLAQPIFCSSWFHGKVRVWSRCPISWSELYAWFPFKAMVFILNIPY